MKRQERAPDDVRPDMTPMIDMIFQLIVFFALVNDFSNLERMAEISVPLADQARIRPLPEAVVVNVTQAGAWRVFGEACDETRLARLFEEAARRSAAGGEAGVSDVPVYIRGDAGAEYGRVRRVMVLAQQAGLWKISFAGTKPAG